MTGEQIIIEPQDLQEIIDYLHAYVWSGGPVIIRDIGSKFVVRDINENQITYIEKTIYKDG